MIIKSEKLRLFYLCCQLLQVEPPEVPSTPKLVIKNLVKEETPVKEPSSSSAKVRFLRRFGALTGKMLDLGFRKICWLEGVF